MLGRMASEVQTQELIFAGIREMSRVRTSRGVLEGDAGTFAGACGIRAY